LGRLRQKNLKFKASLGYLERPYLKNKNKQTKKEIDTYPSKAEA
jgi:hypothetical protein